MTALPPIRREIVVPAPPDVAFAVFTRDLGRWWPLASHSVYGAAATVAFVDGVVVESAPDRDDTVWGTVLAWEPPTHLTVSWHPGRGPDTAGRVEVTFTAVAAGTAVRLVHSGWESYADPAAARARYDDDRGWPLVLDAYAAATGPTRTR